MLEELQEQELRVFVCTGKQGGTGSGSSLGMPLGGICVRDGKAAALLSAVFSTAKLLSAPLGGFWGSLCQREALIVPLR